MKKNLHLITFLLLFLSCTEDKPSVQTIGTLTLVDSSQKAQNLWEYDAYNRMGYYPIYYLGKQNDTLFLGQHTIYRLGYYQSETLNFRQIVPFSTRKHLSIWVDTSFSISHGETYTHFDKEKEQDRLDSVKYYKAYPVFIHNISDSLISIGIFSELGYTVRQALNAKGHWVDIEIPMEYRCGTGARNVLLKPQEIAVAKLLRYKGDFQAPCRLKFQHRGKAIYSNIFTDYIHKKQLSEPLKKLYE